ncbi:MAG: hypothetical protein KBE65_06750 [Phycisphaerae bacterium]|nr:hypothetical protein [Phycisphaerae bacterium]
MRSRQVHWAWKADDHGDADQRKDERAWQEFAARSPREFRDLAADVNNAAIADPNIDDDEPLYYPPVWVSNPEPNNVRVFVSIYDRAGHESESYELTPFERQ